MTKNTKSARQAKRLREVRELVSTIVLVLDEQKRQRRSQRQIEAAVDRTFARVTVLNCDFPEGFADALMDAGYTSVAIADLVRDAARRIQ
jgi:hypothetical protein